MAIFGKNKKITDKKEEGKKAPSSSSAKKESKKETMKDLYGGVKTKKGSTAKTKSNAKKESKKETMKDLYGEVKTEKRSITKTKKTEEKKINYNSAYKLLIKPLITEKAANLATENKYVFEVSKGSNKIEIAKAVEEVYGLKPIKVNIVNMEGKRKKQGNTVGRRKDWKKAVVTLKKGEAIDVYEGV